VISNFFIDRPLFATVVYVTNLPALMYASQVFPTMLASVTAFVAFIAVVRVLPERARTSSRRRLRRRSSRR